MLGPAALDQPEAGGPDIGVIEAGNQLVAGQGLGPDGAGGGKFQERDCAIAEVGDVAERENSAKYMKS